MATTMTPTAHAGEIKFQYGRPEFFALKFLEPKVFDGSFGPRGMFTTCDEGYGERKIWMDYEDASNLVIELRRLKIAVGDPIRVTKIKHPRGGGHGYLVARADAAQVAPAWVTEDAPEEATPIEAQLAHSVHLVRTQGPQVFQRPAAQPVTVAPAEASPQSARFMLAYKDAIDVLLDARAYAQHKGLAIEVRCEDVRCLAATIIIQNTQGGR